MMKTMSGNKKIASPISFAVLIAALAAASFVNFAMSSSYISTELYASAALISANFLLTLFFDQKALTTGNFLVWGMLLKMAKSFFVFLVIAVLCIAKLVADPKLLAFTFLIGFTITMIFEVLCLQKFTKKKQD